MTALHWAVNNGHVEACQLLLRSGADLNAKDNVRGWECSDEAIYYENIVVA